MDRGVGVELHVRVLGAVRCGGGRDLQQGVLAGAVRDPVGDAELEQLVEGLGGRQRGVLTDEIGTQPEPQINSLGKYKIN